MHYSGMIIDLLLSFRGGIDTCLKLFYRAFSGHRFLERVDNFLSQYDVNSGGVSFLRGTEKINPGTTEIFDLIELYIRI